MDLAPARNSYFPGRTLKANAARLARVRVSRGGTLAGADIIPAGTAVAVGLAHTRLNPGVRTARCVAARASARGGAGRDTSAALSGAAGATPPAGPPKQTRRPAIIEPGYYSEQPVKSKTQLLSQATAPNAPNPKSVQAAP